MIGGGLVYTDGVLKLVVGVELIEAVCSGEVSIKHRWEGQVVRQAKLDTGPLDLVRESGNVVNAVECRRGADHVNGLIGYEPDKA